MLNLLKKPRKVRPIYVLFVLLFGTIVSYPILNKAFKNYQYSEIEFRADQVGRAFYYGCIDGKVVLGQLKHYEGVDDKAEAMHRHQAFISLCKRHSAIFYNFVRDVSRQRVKSLYEAVRGFK